MGLRRVTALVITGLLMVSCSDGEADSSEAETPAVEETTEAPAEDAGEHPDQQAVDLCLEAAKIKLANPDTAVFGDAYFTEPDGDDEWMISGNFTALGEDGVSVEGIWQCMVEYDDVRSLWLTNYIGVAEL